MWKTTQLMKCMLGCQQSAQGNSGIIIGASIWLAIAADHFGPFGKYATENGQWPAVIFNSEMQLTEQATVAWVVHSPAR